ncbi:NUDIX hydrolase [Haladaptatus sp. DYSN1]|uniref:NUDIX hydrolase n=1 Tax=unclassified Haladaptatus TaxID=2622732 RepID=UPI002406BA51|nr:NUDIX domain-containing protein [Haladaptatus sp. DYSN1]
MSWRDIRPVVLGLVRRNDEILVGRGYDPESDEVFWRPLGGGMQFGESSEETVCREFEEELGVELETVEFLSHIENRFTFDGEQGHEIVLLYEGDLADDEVYEAESMTGYEEELDEEFEVRWLQLADFESGDRTLYPEAVVDVAKNERCDGA